MVKSLCKLQPVTCWLQLINPKWRRQTSATYPCLQCQVCLFFSFFLKCHPQNAWSLYIFPGYLPLVACHLGRCGTAKLCHESCFHNSWKFRLQIKAELTLQLQSWPRTQMSAFGSGLFLNINKGKEQWKNAEFNQALTRHTCNKCRRTTLPKTQKTHKFHSSHSLSCFGSSPVRCPWRRVHWQAPHVHQMKAGPTRYGGKNGVSRPERENGTGSWEGG